ncbi:unnamed protein product [Durusdinium trenchii]|uniref:Uncharacterized protein n=2 Tax=Durusdinium trenchii TaxID=1381693 RepID=A0ABP0N379_9DINO
MASEDTPLRPGRCTISGEVYKIDGKEVVLMGGNYCVKAGPYYPPLEVVRKDAKLMAKGAKSMAYVPPPAADGTPRPVVPCVRLPALMESALPAKGPIDATFKSKLEETIQAFRDEGVYVFLDMHQDAFGTTNGGEGYPWWVAEDFQKRAGCCLEQCCCCCCFSSSCWSCCPEKCRTSYVSTPQHPLQPFCGLPNCLAKCFNVGITTYSEDPEPWLPYSVGGGQGNPALMNIGNASMRTNNSDDRWSTLITSAQVQNCVPRVYNSAHHAEDKATFFDPFVGLAKYLCSVWDKYENVVALELMNEPLLGGLPNLFHFFTIWRQILSFQADVMEALDEDPSIKCPIAIANWSSTVEGESCFVSCLACFGAPSSAMKCFKSYANQNRLILSFHFYSPPSTKAMEEDIQLAKKNAAKFGGIPIFLSEFWEDSAVNFADKLAMACDEGVSAITYWQYADTEWTGQEGWFKYPASVTSIGTPVDASGNINTAAWDAYSKTVADGTFFGGYITGAGGAQMNVLELVPPESAAVKMERKVWPVGHMTPLHKARRCMMNKEKERNI